LFPTKLLGVIADHGEFPIERIAIDQGGEGRWVGSVGHEESLKLTDLREVFENEVNDEEEKVASGDDDGRARVAEPRRVGSPEEDESGQSDGERSIPRARKKRKREGTKELSGKKRKGRNQGDVSTTFFSDL